MATIHPIEYRLHPQEIATGQTATYSTKMMPEEQGLYTIYAYLYQNGGRLDRETEVVYMRRRPNA